MEKNRAMTDTIGELIEEGLTQSCSHLELFRIVSKKFSEIEITEEKDAPQTFSIRFTTPFEIDNFNKFINNLGWYIAFGVVNDKNYSKQELVDKIKNVAIGTSVEIKVESKYDTVLDNVPLNIFHTTPLVKLAKIKSIGLVPKNYGKLSYHPERIYFALRHDDAVAFAEKSGQIEKNELRKELVILTLDSSKIENTMFNDPNFYMRGCYCVNNVNPNAILKVEKYAKKL
jgi:hypothetical protein